MVIVRGPAQGRPGGLVHGGRIGLAQGVVFCLLSYVLPLAPRPSLLLDPRIVLLAAGGILLLLVQPPARVRDSLKSGSRDRGSFAFILLGAVVGEVVKVVDWAYVRGPRPIGEELPWVVAGFTLVVAGVLLRFWSMAVLGRWFTSVVQVGSGQQVVQDGPYRLVRHPSYLGVMLAGAGGALVLHSVVGLVVCLAALGAAYRYRVLVEERSLEEELGEAYESYRRRVRWRLVPFVW